MSRKLFSSPLRHKGSPSYLLDGPEHDEWHKNNSIVEDDSIGKKSIEPITTRQESVLTDSPKITKVETGKSAMELGKKIKEKKVTQKPKLKYIKGKGYDKHSGLPWAKAQAEWKSYQSKSQITSIEKDEGEKNKQEQKRRLLRRVFGHSISGIEWCS